MSASTIPVHILTGFLGSGKTTLLNRALASGFGPETAVIVNEFGEMALDHLFVETRSEETLVLKSGCVCCSVRTDLVAALMQLAAMANSGAASFSRVVIETSGISDPVPILATLRSDFNLLARFHIGATVCAVDAIAPALTRNRDEIFMQVAAADLCVLTKTDLADEAAAESARDWVHAVNPIAEIADAAEFDFLPWFKQHERPAADLDQRLSALENISGSGARAHKVRSIVLRTEKHFSWPSFAVWLSALVHLHGDRILRVKGMLWDEEREAWIGVHCVRRFLYPPEHLLSASHTSGHTACLVFITENLDPVSIEKSYRRWVLSQAEEKPGRRGPHRNEDVSSPFHHSETPSQESPNVK